MRILVISILVFITILTFGQERKWNKMTLIFFDGKRISHKDVKAMDTSQFSILTVSSSKVTGEVFGRKHKTGVAHFKSEEFIENQERLIQDLRQEFETDVQGTRTLMINGVTYKRDEELEEKFLLLKPTDIEWIFIGRDKTMRIIQTNVLFEMPSH